VQQPLDQPQVVVAVVVQPPQLQRKLKSLRRKKNLKKWTLVEVSSVMTMSTELNDCRLISQWTCDKLSDVLSGG
jgi:hypothetical protein